MECSFRPLGPVGKGGGTDGPLKSPPKFYGKKERSARASLDKGGVGMCHLLSFSLRPDPRLTTTPPPYPLSYVLDVFAERRFYSSPPGGVKKGSVLERLDVAFGREPLLLTSSELLAASPLSVGRGGLLHRAGGRSGAGGEQGRWSGGCGDKNQPTHQKVGKS